MCFRESSGSIARIQCPSGMVIDSFPFASFGNARGKYCGHFSLGSCHAEQSEAILQDRCGGRQYCEVETSSSLFGGVTGKAAPGMTASEKAKGTGEGLDGCPVDTLSLLVEYQCVTAPDAQTKQEADRALQTFFSGTADATASSTLVSHQDQQQQQQAQQQSHVVVQSSNVDDTWENSQWGTLHRCRWAGVPHRLAAVMTEEQLFDPVNLYFGRFRGVFVGQDQDVCEHLKSVFPCVLMLR